MSMHDSPHFNPNGFQEDFADYIGGLPADGPSEWILGELQGDVATPREPVRDREVLDWEELTEPRLSPAHDTVGRALASFFNRAGGWVYLTQDMVAASAKLSRQTTCRYLNDLARVGRFERRDIITQEGNRGDAYRLTGEDTGWVPTDLGMPDRTTVADFAKDKEIAQLKEAVRYLAPFLTGDEDLPDSVLTLVNSVTDIPSDREEKSSYYRKVDSLNGNNKGALSSKMLDSALEASAQERRDWVTESQIVTILAERDRTGLSEDDIRASWPDIHPGSEPPAGFEPGWLTKSRAFRLVGWLRKQPDAPLPKVEPVESDIPCTCMEHPPGPKSPDPAAADTWNGVLGELELEIPPTTFETWLKPTEGVALDGLDLLVEVPSKFAVEWLEQRMYQTILRALRLSSGQPLDVRFQASTESCPLHGSNSSAAVENSGGGG